MGGDEVADFVDHEECYDRASDHGPFSEETTDRMQELYSGNQAESYYGGKRPSHQQTTSIVTLAEAVHSFVVDQIREGGVCICDSS